MSPSFYQQSKEAGDIVCIQMLEIVAGTCSVETSPAKHLQDNAVSVKTWKDMFNMHSHCLVLLLTLWKSKPMPKEMQLLGDRKKFCMLDISVTYFSPILFKILSFKIFLI